MSAEDETSNSFGIGRRKFLTGAAALGASAFAMRLQPVLAGTATAGPSPYGALQPADANGVRLPAGFSSRIVAVSGQAPAPGIQPWHHAPDGGAVFDTPTGGWIYASNSERSSSAGGVGALEFDSAGTVISNTTILSGTTRNCAGGATPWGTWISCEETSTGYAWETDPTGVNAPIRRDLLGRFKHEAAAVDSRHEVVYLTEDEGDGRYYRFTPLAYPDLGFGTLEAAAVSPSGDVTWHPVPDPVASSMSTRYQAPASTPFDGGEGIWFDGRWAYFTTKGDNTVWAHDTVAETILPLYEASDFTSPILTGVDNIVVSPAQELYIAEDGGDMQLVLIDENAVVSPFLQFSGHGGSEVTGPAFTADGQRLYVSSQRGTNGNGITFEISGPFRPAVTRVCNEPLVGPAI